MGALMLAVTVAGAMAAGVLMAYGVCQAMFRLFHMHTRSLRAKTATVNAAQVVQS